MQHRNHAVRARPPVTRRFAGWASAALVVVTLAALPMAAGEEKPPAPATQSAADVAAIRAAAASYRAALAKGDAAAIKNAWAADGDIVDGWGNLTSAADAATLLGDASAKPGQRPEFHVGETRLRFVAADVALEDGEVNVVLPGMKTPIEGSFSAVWVRREGAWKLASLREAERPVATDETMLADLDWMVGDWVLSIDGQPGATPPAMEMRVRWDAGGSFLVRDAIIPVGGSSEPTGETIEVHQRIGWDPLVKRIRGWSFASDGSRGEATWLRDGDSWVAVQTAVLPDGRQETSTSIYSYDGGDRCVWRTLPDSLTPVQGLPTRATWVRKPGSNAK